MKICSTVHHIDRDAYNLSWKKKTLFIYNVFQIKKYISITRNQLVLKRKCST